MKNPSAAPAQVSGPFRDELRLTLESLAELVQDTPDDLLRVLLTRAHQAVEKAHQVIESRDMLTAAPQPPAARRAHLRVVR